MRPPTEYGAEADDVTANQENNEDDPQVTPAMMICTRLAGRAIIRVVTRCNDAQENCHLDLSDCQLMQVPDAVYHLMRHTELKSCNLSENSIAKIPPKFAFNFSMITELNLSHNQMSKLPDELQNVTTLETIDVSHNAFTILPHPVYKLPKLRILNANNNYIMEVEVDKLTESQSLEIIDLTENPLTNQIRLELQKVTSKRATFTVPQSDEDDWEPTEAQI